MKGLFKNRLVEKRENKSSNRYASTASKMVISGIALIFFFLASFFATSLLLEDNSKPRAKSVKAPIISPSESPQVGSDLYVGNEDLEPGKEYRCPVCGKVVSALDSEFRHRDPVTGEILLFDREECYRKFLNNPTEYVRPKVRIKIKPRISPEPELIEEVPVEDLPVEGAPTPEVVPDSPGYNPENEIIEDIPLGDDEPVEYQSPKEPVENLQIEDVPLDGHSGPPGSQNQRPSHQPPDSPEIKLPPGAIPARPPQKQQLDSTPISPPENESRTY